MDTDETGVAVEAADAVEMRRILTAAGWGALSVNRSGRYVIADGARPQRKVREKALRRGWIGFRYRHGQGNEVYLTVPGQRALALLEGSSDEQ